MGLAMKQMELADGKTKEEAEEALVQIAKQLGKMDELIKVRVDHEVWKLFQEQQQSINERESIIKETVK